MMKLITKIALPLALLMAPSAAYAVLDENGADWVAAKASVSECNRCALHNYFTSATANAQHLRLLHKNTQHRRAINHFQPSKALRHNAASISDRIPYTSIDIHMVTLPHAWLLRVYHSVNIRDLQSRSSIHT